MEATTTTPERLNADEYVRRLAEACKLMGYDVHIHEPSTRLTVSRAWPKPHTRETIVLRATEGDELWWFWAWALDGETPIVEAHRIGDAAEAIAKAVR